MAKRIWAASFIAILGAGSMLASDVAAGGHRAAIGAGALHAPVGKTVARAQTSHAFRGAARLHHRHSGLPLTGWWTNGWYGGTYPSNDAMLHNGFASAYDRPAFADTVPSYPPVYSGGPYLASYAAPPARRPLDVIVYRPGCSSETQTVPWSDGKDRTITMVRC
jgi:hypothetical protein